MMGADHERETATGPRPYIHSGNRPDRQKPDYMVVKVFVVMRRVFSANRDAPNVEVLDVKLNLAAAQALVDANAGTWLERVLADKRTLITKRD